MSAPRARKPAFAARVRWRCEADPRWEMETLHAGFAQAEDAALFANGFSTRSPSLLELDRGRFHLGFTDGTAEQVRAGAYQLWRLPRDFDPAHAADDSSFEPVDASPSDLSEMGLDGRWGQLAYGVVGPKGEGVDVLLEVDDTGGLKVITIDQQPEMADHEPASFSMAVLPKA